MSSKKKVEWILSDSSYIFLNASRCRQDSGNKVPLNFDVSLLIYAHCKFLPGRVILGAHDPDQGFALLTPLF